MITRTFITTKVSAMVANPETATVETRDFTLAGKLEGKELAKALNKACASANVVFVKVNTLENLETLYGMEEDFFLANAKVLPPRGTKSETPETVEEAPEKTKKGGKG